MIYLDSIWTSSVQHGEDGQVGAQVGNCRTGGALVTSDMKPHCTLHSLHVVISQVIRVKEEKVSAALEIHVYTHLTLIPHHGLAQPWENYGPAILL